MFAQHFSKTQILLAMPFLVVGWCLFLLWVVSHVSGWAKLAKSHRADHRPDGMTFHMRSLHFAPGMGYNNCLSVVLAQTGVYMVPFFLVRFAHPALLIPWSRVGTLQRGRFLFLKWHYLPIYAAGRRFRLFLPKSAKEWIERDLSQHRTDN
jgi:hypothetical protein